MPYTTRRLIPRAAVAALLLVASAPRAHAQQTTPAIAPAPATPDFMSRYDFHLSAAAVSINDPRFSWETHFGGDIDVADYIVGRSSILVDYEAVLGDEFRPFDPNQGNYTLEASSSARIGETEVSCCFPSRVAAFERSTETIRNRVERSWRACSASRDDPGIHHRRRRHGGQSRPELIRRLHVDRRSRPDDQAPRESKARRVRTRIRKRLPCRSNRRTAP